MAGTETGLPAHAGTVALAAMAAIVVRIGLEHVAATQYPQRLDTVDPDTTPPPTVVADVTGVLVRTGIFAFFGYAFIGICAAWWLGVLLFLLPQAAALVRHRLPTHPGVHRIVPRGIVEIFVLIVTCTLAVRFVVGGSVNDLEALRVAFVVLAVPPAILGLMSLFADDEAPGATRSWWREIVGLVLLIGTTALALNGWST